MTENTPTPAERRKLVAEARLRHDRIAGHFPGETVSPLSTRLADALEAVTAERDALAVIPIDAITDRLYSLSNDALKRIGDQCFYMIAERNADGVTS